MKHKLFSTIVLTISALTFSSAASAADDVISDKYTRSSIYSILVNHTEQRFAGEIRSQFLNIPTPDQYNDHDLSVKVIDISKNANYSDSIDNFIKNNYIASRMVAKWFNRDMLTGECSMDLIKERGVYNASEMDKEIALRSPRGISMLEDAGEELIGQSFLLVNEISYIDKGKKSKIFGSALKIAGSIAGNFVPGVSSLTDNLGDMISSLKGFKVKITTRLYQLQWNDEHSGTFYKMCYTDVPDEDKRQAFEDYRGQFSLVYIGSVESAGSTTSFMGINEEEPLLMVRKACQRALDDNVADLQKKYDQFRVKAPLKVGADGVITAAIGKKEGITPDSKFEVLEAREKNGKIEYKKVGEVQAIDKKIWDNRFMAEEEQAYGATFGATTFKKLSGNNFYSGLLIRAIN